MQVDGRQIPVHGNVLQPLTRRTSDILRVVASAVFLGLVIVGSVITRSQWMALERSISDIVGVLTPSQSNAVYLVYSIAILALPFTVLAGLVAARRWRLLGGYLAAAAIAALSLSISPSGISAPGWHIDESTRLDTLASQVLDDPRWIAIVAAVLTVSGPGLPARWRRTWWFLLLAFVPIHLVVSTVVPARSLIGLSVGWLAGSVVVLVVGTPALEVPLDRAVRELGRRGVSVTALTVVRPAGAGPLLLSGDTGAAGPGVVIELFGPNQRSRGALRYLQRIVTLRPNENAPLHASQRRAVEHRALMGIAVDALGVSAITPTAVADLGRGWVLYAHSVARGRPPEPGRQEDVVAMWRTLGVLRSRQIAHGSLRPSEVRLDVDDTALLDGFGTAELGASPARLRTDAAQLLLTTASLVGPDAAVDAAVTRLGETDVVAASRRLTPSAIPRLVREEIEDAKALMTATRDTVAARTGIGTITAEQVTRFSRNQIIQLVLLIALVYVAYPFVGQLPTFATELRSIDWGWAAAGLAISAATYFGAAAALWACASGQVSYWHTTVMQVANTFAATTTPAGVGGLALSVRFLQKGGVSVARSTAAVALQQLVQVIAHVTLLVAFSVAAGQSADLARFVPGTTILYLIAGVAFGVLGAFLFVPTLRRFLRTAVRPQLAEVWADLRDLARNPGRFAIIVAGCAATTLGAAAALWVSVEAFGGGTTFVTVTVVTMIGGTLASAAPTPGGVGAVEAALIGGLAAFGLPAAVAVPSVLLYRVLTCWIPVFLGWPIMRWMTRRELI
ncbi:lysylphosphatidylglycerol synthase transmembrane domain-containing protein [Rhodococcoides corynebacterioides]|uniref:Flippase-like domain-containing protein n=1 Tax=Rhodococcoides corynebacterioides TaxID=53972 RepID=A0ABS7P3F5_9NOCA|nr:lysylphosphatidylglycerol synthase transmembrane domain-containing protein [Rhodococcus corynebacterioides]MBY6366830.1 flippase-like domain-containing protein [Rhodococcus corynebacterioides]MBY6408410.1 flippase-like domain-containing protein [Rhodococcus corynebacterioides]